MDSRDHPCGYCGTSSASYRTVREAKKMIINVIETDGRTFGVKSDYVELCKVSSISDVHCGGAILTALERWYTFKLNERIGQVQARLEAIADGRRGRRVTASLWVYMSQREWQEKELMGFFSLRKIRETLAELVAAGLVARRNNPHRAADRTYQYLLLVSRVQAHLSAMRGGVMRGYMREALSGVAQSIKGILARINVPKRIKQGVKRMGSMFHPALCIVPGEQNNTTISKHNKSSTHRTSQIKTTRPSIRDVITSHNERPTGGEIHHPIYQDNKQFFKGRVTAEALNKAEQRLGKGRVREVVERCREQGRTWTYVVRALENEPTIAEDTRNNSGGVLSMNHADMVACGWIRT